MLNILFNVAMVPYSENIVTFARITFVRDSWFRTSVLAGLSVNAINPLKQDEVKSGSIFSLVATDILHFSYR